MANTSNDRPFFYVDQPFPTIDYHDEIDEFSSIGLSNTSKPTDYIVTPQSFCMATTGSWQPNVTHYFQSVFEGGNSYAMITEDSLLPKGYASGVVSYSEGSFYSDRIETALWRGNVEVRMRVPLPLKQYLAEELEDPQALYHVTFQDDLHEFRTYKAVAKFRPSWEEMENEVYLCFVAPGKDWSYRPASFVPPFQLLLSLDATCNSSDYLSMVKNKLRQTFPDGKHCDGEYTYSVESQLSLRNKPDMNDLCRRFMVASIHPYSLEKVRFVGTILDLETHASEEFDIECSQGLTLTMGSELTDGWSSFTKPSFQLSPGKTYPHNLTSSQSPNIGTVYP